MKFLQFLILRALFNTKKMHNNGESWCVIIKIYIFSLLLNTKSLEWAKVESWRTKQALAGDWSPPQEIEVSKHSSPYLLAYINIKFILSFKGREEEKTIKTK